MKQQVSADKVAVASAKQRRKAAILQLLALYRSDAAALRATSHQLMLARRHSKKAGSSRQFPADVTGLSSLVTQLKQTVNTDAKAIATDRHTDFTAIHAARQKLAADVRAMRKALRTNG